MVNRRDTRAYVHGIHRDIRFSSDSKRFMLNLLVMLDDFTLENGATHLLSGSQHCATSPTTVFVEEAASATGTCGLDPAVRLKPVACDWRQTTTRRGAP